MATEIKFMRGITDEHAQKKRWCSEAGEVLIHGLMLAHNISEEEDSFKTAVGRAWPRSRSIKIPEKIDSPKKFMVALHEIGHVVNCEKKFGYHFEEEHACEKYAIDVAKSTQVCPIRSVLAYEEGARLYVMGYIRGELEEKEDPVSLISNNIQWWLGNLKMKELKEYFYSN